VLGDSAYFSEQDLKASVNKPKEQGSTAKEQAASVKPEEPKEQGSTTKAKTNPVYNPKMTLNAMEKAKSNPLGEQQPSDADAAASLFFP